MNKSLFQSCQYTISERGSRFITYAYPVSTENEITEALESCKKTWPDATHHCYAWRIDPEQVHEYTNDDGEPSGTAGQPILNEIRSWELINVLVVVVRYFGGTKLGKPGLIDAYRTSTRKCLEQADISTIHPVRKLEVTFPYSEQKTVNQLQHKYGLKKENEEYQAEVSWQLSCPQDKAENLISEIKHMTYRGINFKDLGSYYDKLKD